MTAANRKSVRDHTKRRLVGYCWRNLANPVPGIPDLKHNIEDLPLDLPRCTAWNTGPSMVTVAIDRANRAWKVGAQRCQ